MTRSTTKVVAALLLALPLASHVVADTDPNCELLEVAVGDTHKCALMSNDGTPVEQCVGKETSSIITLGEKVEPKTLVQGSTSACFVNGTNGQVHCHATGKEETYEAKAFKGQGKSDSFVVEKDLLAMYGSEVCGVSKEGDAQFLQCGNVSDSKATRKIDIDAKYTVKSVHVGSEFACVSADVKDEEDTEVMCWVENDLNSTYSLLSGESVSLGSVGICGVNKEDPEVVSCFKGDDWAEDFEFPEAVLAVSFADQVDKDGKHTYQACAAVGDKLPGDLYCWGNTPSAIKGQIVGEVPEKVLTVTSVTSISVTMNTMCGMNNWGVRCLDLTLATGDLDDDKKPVKDDSVFDVKSVLWATVEFECAAFNPLFLIIAGSLVGVVVLGGLAFVSMGGGSDDAVVERESVVVDNPTYRDL